MKLSTTTVRPRWVAAALVSALLVAAAGLGLRVIATVEETLNENWRGLYDILVTAPGQDFGATDTQGVVDPNFVATAGEGGISLDDLAQIRRILGVEVAAPIGMVGAVRRTAFGGALVFWDDPVGGVTDLPSGGIMAEIVATYVMTDGTEETLVSQGRGRIWLQQRDVPDVDLVNSYKITGVGTPGFAPGLTNASFNVQLGQMPAFASSIIAVDPIAEMQLLGDERAAFLAPLSQSPDIREAAATWQEVMDCQLFFLQCSQVNVAVKMQTEFGTQLPLVVPLVVSGEVARELTLRVEIAVAEASSRGGFDDFGAAVAQLEAFSSDSFVPWKSVEVDISDALLPFSTVGLGVLIPGSSAPAGEDGGAFYSIADQLAPQLIGRPSFIETDESAVGGVGFSVVPEAVLNAGGLNPFPAYDGMDPGVGLVRAYRSVSDPGGVGGVLPAPLGTFTVADISDEASDDVSYVPSGVSGVTSTWRVDESGGLVEVLPNLSGLDFITAAPGAFTDLIGGATLRGSTPIDAVRVRVAGITDYSQASQQRIMQVAGQIALLGLDVRIVAGSSPQQVSLYVPEYFQEEDGSWSDLGWVFQDWTTLGATATVEAALSGTTVVLVVVALAAGGFGLGVTALTGGLRLRPIVAGLDRIGWRRSYIRRRLAFELAPPYLLLAVTSGLCWWLGPPRLGAVFLAAIGVAVALFATELVSGMRTSRKSFPTGGSSRGSVVLSPEGLAWCLVRGRAWWALLTVVSSVVVVVLAALTIVAVRDGAVRAGATRLATLMVSTTQWLTTGIGVLGVGSAVVLLLLGYRAERAASVGDALVFTRLGFTTGVQRRVAWLQQLFIAAACVATTAVVLTGVSVLFGGGWLVWLVGGGTLVLVVATKLVAGSFTRKGG